MQQSVQAATTQRQLSKVEQFLSGSKSRSALNQLRFVPRPGRGAWLGWGGRLV